MEKKKKMIDKLLKKIIKSYEDRKGINHIDGLNLPSRKDILIIHTDLFKLIFPGFFEDSKITYTNLKYYIGNLLCKIYDNLVIQVEKTLKYLCLLEKCNGCDCASKSKEMIYKFLNEIPNIRELLKSDIKAALDGDPAAKSLDEVIISYPATYAITTYRLAHEMYKLKIPLIPRIMTEHAHSKTGIDIHPGAKIGKHFFIDHGTGVVIGETTVIGNNVKIYQGATLGALSFPKDKKTGKIIKGLKRHPTIEDNVTIYAGATILGGKTVIGKNSVVGGNTWITESIAPNSKVLLSKSKDIILTKKTKNAKNK